MSKVKVAATQMACSWDIDANLDRAESLVRRAAVDGAQLVLLQELFATPYFCPDEKPDYFQLAAPVDANPLISRFSSLARELGVVLPLSFFERANNNYFNALAMIDANGAMLGVYRKCHIPQGPGYREKYYFTPGDTGFRVFDTAIGRMGAAICWDQWFPEAARLMALKGAELLLYPTAIGSEPVAPDYDSSGHWRRTMQGHAAANMVPVLASNRIGTEASEAADLRFYGGSFITDQFGAVVAEADREREAVISWSFDLSAIQPQRASWGLFRDRRPELYRGLASLDGA